MCGPFFRHNTAQKAVKRRAAVQRNSRQYVENKENELHGTIFHGQGQKQKEKQKIHQRPCQRDHTAPQMTDAGCITGHVDP